MSDSRLNVLLQQTRDAAMDARDFVEGLEHSGFMSDPKTQNAVAMALVRVGTNATRIVQDYRDIARVFQASHGRWCGACAITSPMTTSAWTWR